MADQLTVPLSLVALQWMMIAVGIMVPPFIMFLSLHNHNVQWF
jgi:hypothetical protein